MSKPTLFLQFRTDESLQHEQEMIRHFGHFSENNLEVINVLDFDAKLPQPEDLDKYQAVITGASGQFNVTDWPDDIRTRVEQLLPFIREIVRRDFPTLAICFGHQLLARLLGGEVRRDLSQAESGTLPVYLTEVGKKSVIYRGIKNNSFYVVLGHKDSVTKLPKGAVLLAYSDRCKVQSYQLKNNIFCVQFHPELDLDGLMWRIRMYPEYLLGKTAEGVRATYHEIPDAHKIIANFLTHRVT